MATLDFSKAVDFSPVEKLGMSKENGIKFLAALSPIIDLEFQKKIKNAFTEEEMSKIGEEAEGKGIKPEDGLFFLEEKYHEKTGNYFMEEMRLLFNRYIIEAAKIIEQTKSDTETFAATGEENVKKFDDLMKEEKWEEAARLLDDTLKIKENSLTPETASVQSKTN